MNKQMNGKSFSSPEGISLKEYINDKFDNLERSIDTRFDSVTLSTNAALASADKAVAKAELAVEKRLEGLNELRGMALDQQRTFVPRHEIEILIESMNNKVDALNLTTISRQGKDIGQREGMVIVSLIAGIISAAIAILFKFL